MKITYLSCVDRYCGLGRYSEELATSVHNQSHQVTLFRKGESTAPFIRSYPYRSLRNLRYYIAPFFLGQAIRPVQSQIWHADYVDGSFALMLAGKQKQKVVVTAHDAIPYLFEPGKIDMWWYKSQLAATKRIADVILVVSHTSKRDLEQYAHIPADRIQVVYNGISHTHFYPDTSKKENPVCTIRYVGGLSKHKNVEVLLQAAKILEDRRVEFRLEIGGASPAHTPLPALATQLGLKQVSFTGFLAEDKLRSFLAEADLFVFPSLYEGFGFPPLEAMASGTAVISSNRGSLPEVLGEGAYLVDPTPPDFADAIQLLISDKALRLQYQERGKEVAAKYTWSETARQTVDLYHQI